MRKGHSVIKTLNKYHTAITHNMCVPVPVPVSVPVSVCAWVCLGVGGSKVATRWQPHSPPYLLTVSLTELRPTTTVLTHPCFRKVLNRTGVSHLLLEHCYGLNLDTVFSTLVIHIPDPTLLCHIPVHENTSSWSLYYLLDKEKRYISGLETCRVVLKHVTNPLFLWWI
jgi:hypothetical protein